MKKANRLFKRVMPVVVTGAMVLSVMPATIYAQKATEVQVNEALAEAAELKYVTMNIPYRDFYEALGVQVDNKDYCYDAVTTATTRFFWSGSGVSKGTYSHVEKDGENVTGGQILGVTYPVAMTAEAYAELSQSPKTTEENYYFTDCTETPDSYMTLNYSGGTYNFSADTIKENSAEGLEVINFTTESDYGDYQIELKGLYTQKTENETAIPGVIIGDKTNLSISGVILTTDDGNHYGMGMLENNWVGTRREWVEVGWSVPEGNGLTNHGGAPFKTFDTNGKTLTEVKVITDQGIYVIGCNQPLAAFYSGSEPVEAEITDPQTLQIRVPSAFQNPKVTVSYKNGRSVVNVAENASITNNTVALEGVLETETAYSVKVSSDNYPAKIIKVTYGTSSEGSAMTDAQKTKLNEYISLGTALVNVDSGLSILNSHVQEAVELLAKEDATSAEAEELIGELEELIKEAQQKYPDVTPGSSSNAQSSSITLKNKTAAYTGKAIAIDGATVNGSTGAITYKYYSDKNCTKEIAASNVKNAGTYYVKATVAADSSYQAATSSAATLKITKAAQKITKAVTSKTLKSAKLKKAAQSFSIGAKATSGKVTYKKTSGNQKIKVSTAGKVQVAKGMKKGTYKIKVQIKAGATANYAAKTQTTTIKITVK